MAELSTEASGGPFDNSDPPPESAVPPATPTGAATVVIGGAGGQPSGIVDEARVIAAMQPAFRACYEQGLRDDPSMRGSLRVTAKVDGAGNVIAANPSSGVGLAPAVISCVVARVAAARFTPPPGGGVAIVIPITFHR